MSVDLVDRDVLLVGAGKVALRKAQDLLDCGARLRVVAPWFAPGFANLAGTWTKIERTWTPGDEQGARLVVAATSDPEAIRKQLVAQVTGTVRWRESVPCSRTSIASAMRCCSCACVR